MYISTINKQSLSTTNFLIADIISLNCALTALNGFLPDEYQKTSIFLVWSRLNYSDLDPTFLGLMYNISKYNDIQIIAADMVTFLQQLSLNSFRSTDSNIEYFNEQPYQAYQGPLVPFQNICSMDPKNKKKCTEVAYLPWWANGPYSPSLGCY